MTEIPTIEIDEEEFYGGVEVSTSSINKLRYASRGQIPIRLCFLDFLNGDTEFFDYDEVIKDNYQTAPILLEYEDAEILIKQNEHRILKAGDYAVVEALNVVNFVDFSRQNSDRRKYVDDAYCAYRISCLDPKKNLLSDFCNDYAAHEMISNLQKQNILLEISRSADIIANLNEKMPVVKRITKPAAIKMIHKILRRDLNSSWCGKVSISDYPKALDIIRTMAVTELIENMVGIYRPDEYTVNIEESKSQDDVPEVAYDDIFSGGA